MNTQIKPPPEERKKKKKDPHRIEVPDMIILYFLLISIPFRFDWL